MRRATKNFSFPGALKNLLVDVLTAPACAGKREMPLYVRGYSCVVKGPEFRWCSYPA
jgi:hypothetical protein